MLKHRKIRFVAVLCIPLTIGLLAAEEPKAFSGEGVDLVKLLPGWTSEQIYSNDFKDFDPENWVMEGPGTYKAVKAKSGSALQVETLIWKEMREAWEKNQRKASGADNYYGNVERLLRKKAPDRLPEVTAPDGSVKGGHIVLWNKKLMLPDSYLITYKFQPLTPIGLAILFVSGHAANGGDIFSDRVKERTGIFSHYTKGDINSYHISYRAAGPGGIRGTNNLRKNSGFFNLASAKDPCVKNLNYTDKEPSLDECTITMIKARDRIIFIVNGIKTIDVVDKEKNEILKANGSTTGKIMNTGPVHGGGRLGFRHMVSMAAQYSDLEVYRLSEK